MRRSGSSDGMQVTPGRSESKKGFIEALHQISDQLDVLREEFDRQRAASAELSAENDRLRWHLDRAQPPSRAGNFGHFESFHSDSEGPDSPLKSHSGRNSFRRSASPLGADTPRSVSVVPEEDVDALDELQSNSMTSKDVLLQSKAPSANGANLVSTGALAKVEPTTNPEKSETLSGVPDPTPVFSTEGQPFSQASQGSFFEGKTPCYLSSDDDVTEADTPMKSYAADAAAVTDVWISEAPGAVAGRARADTADSVEIPQLELQSLWLRANSRRGTGLSRRRLQTWRAYKANMELLRWDQYYFRKSWVIHPNSYFANIWDAITIAMLAYDMIFVPLQAFDLGDFPVVEIVCTAGWTFDLFLLFFRGYEKNGNIELRFKKIVHRYVTTWFLFDLTVIALDWCLFIFSSQKDFADVLWWRRLRRIVRLIRLARLLRHGKKCIAIVNFVKSETRLAFFRIVALMMVLVGITHFVCCGWYAIGQLDDDYGNTWNNEFFRPHHSKAYRYWTSFHWSITQFTPASMEVVPTNTIERCYCSMMILCGLLIFSAFVSSMTASITYLTKMQFEKAGQRESLRRYICERSVSLRVGNDLLTHLERPKTERRLMEKDIVCIRDFPNDLMEKLHREVHAPVLTQHPLFEILHNKDPWSFTTICHHAIKQRSCQDGENVFRFGSKCESVVFTVAGKFSYAGGFGDHHVVIDFGSGAWFCEPCVWVKWDHHGALTATSAGCELALVIASEVQLVLGRSRLFNELRRYARAYAQAVGQEAGSVDGLTDACIQGDKAARLVDIVFREMNDVDSATEKINALRPKAINEKVVFDAWRKRARYQKRLAAPGMRGTIRRFFALRSSRQASLLAMPV